MCDSSSKEWILSELNEKNVILNENPNSKRRKADLIEKSPINDNFNMESLNENLNSSFFIESSETKKEEFIISFSFKCNRWQRWEKS